MNRLILFAFVASVLYTFLGGHIGGRGAVALGHFPNAGMTFRVGTRFTPQNKALNFFEHYLDTYWGALYPKRWTTLKNKRDTSGRMGLMDDNSSKDCEKRADAVTTILSFNQDYIFILWTEICKQMERDGFSPEGGKHVMEEDRALEMGCSETHHRPIGLGSDDDITVVFPETMEAIINTMQGKYGEGCFAAYYRYAELEWDDRRAGAKNGRGKGLAVTKTSPVVKVV